MKVAVEHLRGCWTGRPKDKNPSRTVGHPDAFRSLNTGGGYSHPLPPHLLSLLLILALNGSGNLGGKLLSMVDLVWM